MKTCLPVFIVSTAILLLAACGGQRLSDSEILATADAIRAKTPLPQSSKQVDEREFDYEQLDALEEQYYSELDAAAENDLSRMDFELEWQSTALAEYAEYADSSQPGQSRYSRYVARKTALASESTLVPPNKRASEPTLVPKPVASQNCFGGCTTKPTWCGPNPIKGNVSYNSGEKIYHVAGQEYYNETKISPAYGERWFCTEDEARAAGWRKARK